MPPKNDQTKTGKSKVPLDSKVTPFDPVPYETLDICTSITLLSCVEEDILLRALSVLAKYADAADFNVTYLYKNGILTKLLKLLEHKNVVIIRFTLKLIGRLVDTEPHAKQELLLEQNISKILDINRVFITSRDMIVQEYCSLILGQVGTDITLASTLLKTGVIAAIFNVLQTLEDPDVQFNTLKLLRNILQADEAKDIIPKAVEFSSKTMMCYLKSKLDEISQLALDIMITLTSWKCNVMEDLFKEHRVVETLLEIIFNNDLKKMHKKAFAIIINCSKCRETCAAYVKSEEFIHFCEWAKFCPGKYIIPSITIFNVLTSLPELKQVLFDFGVEDTVLSFFRTQNEVVFYKTCQAVSNLSSHRYCARKILTPVVLTRLTSMLRQTKVPIIPYHEMALKTLYEFMKRNELALNMMIVYQGTDAVMDSLLKGKDEFTCEGYTYLMDIIYIFSTNETLRQQMVHRTVYEILLNTLELEPYELSEKALFVLNQFINNSECRQYFIELNGVEKVFSKLTSTPHEKLFKNILIFLQRLFAYKRMANVFLWGGCIQVLKNVCHEIKNEIPQIHQTINLLYDLYLPLKFHELGRLEVTDHFDSRFYLISTDWKYDFPYLEIIKKQEVSLKCTLYLVDFSVNVTEMLQQVARIPTTILQLGVIPKAPPIKSTKGRSSVQSESRRRSNLKRASSARSQKTSFQATTPTMKISNSTESIETPTSSYMVWNATPPPINYGCISEDPYLPQYVEILKKRVLAKDDCMCFRHQVSVVASFVSDCLSGPVDDGSLTKSVLDVHIESLKYKLGTSIIPLGYMRCGGDCEKALLFKALAEKLYIPTRLIRKKIKGTNRFIYWNEVPLISEDSCSWEDDEEKLYMVYAVVDLMKDVGNLMLVGSPEANIYCGFT